MYTVRVRKSIGLRANQPAVVANLSSVDLFMELESGSPPTTHNTDMASAMPIVCRSCYEINLFLAQQTLGSMMICYNFVLEELCLKGTLK
jgi:hypothetical protein